MYELSSLRLRDMYDAAGEIWTGQCYEDNLLGTLPVAAVPDDYNHGTYLS